MYKIMISAITVFLMITLFYGCNNKQESAMLDITITKLNLPEIVKDLRTENILEPDEIILINNALNRLGSNNPDTLLGMTVRNVYDLQKDFLRQNNYDLLNISSTRISMNMNYNIKYLGIRQIRDTLKNIEGNSVIYEFTNKTDRVIKKIDGLLQFFNAQNTLIKQFQIENTELIQPNGNLQFYKSFSHDINEPRDSIIRFHHDKLIVRWKPLYLEFDSGDIIQMED